MLKESRTWYFGLFSLSVATRYGLKSWRHRLQFSRTFPSKESSFGGSNFFIVYLTSDTMLWFPLINRTLERGNIEWFTWITTEHHKCNIKLYRIWWQTLHMIITNKVFSFAVALKGSVGCWNYTWREHFW